MRLVLFFQLIALCCFPQNTNNSFHKENSASVKDLNGGSFISDSSSIPYDECLVSVGNFTFHSRMTNRWYPGDEGDSDPVQIKIPVPLHVDTVELIDEAGARKGFRYDSTTYFTIDKFLGEIPVKQLTQFLNQDIRVVFRDTALKVYEIAISVWRANGGHKYQSAYTHKIAQIKPPAALKERSVIQFLKEKPENSYLVLEAVGFYDTTKRQHQTLKKVAWKITGTL